MKSLKLSALALVGLIATLSSFKAGPTDYYWFQPSSTTYVTGSVISTVPQDEADRLNTASSTTGYNLTAGALIEEGFLGSQVDEDIYTNHPEPTKDDPGALPDAKVYFQ
jgi:hypothetical protein